MKTLKFKIDESMAKNNNLSLTDLAVMANISKYRNNNVTEFRYGKNIAATLGISERTVDNSIKKLKDNNVFDKIEKINASGEANKGRNKYFFTPLETGFILINDEIFESELTSDEIGFLIRAKANAYANGMSLKGNKEKLASLIGVSFSKFNKILNSLISKGFITYSDSVLTITTDLFKDTSKHTTSENIYKKKIQSLATTCNSDDNGRLATLLKYYVKNEVEVSSWRTIYELSLMPKMIQPNNKNNTEIIL